MEVFGYQTGFIFSLDIFNTIASLRDSIGVIKSETLISNGEEDCWTTHALEDIDFCGYFFSNE